MQNLRDDRDITIKKQCVSWLDVNKFINNLSDFIRTNNFNGVYGPARGGLVFAVMISHIYKLPFLGAPNKGCLIVDDIVDTGKTAEAWKDKGYKIASMYYKKNNLVEPDFWMFEKNDNWIIFPWECICNNNMLDEAEDTLLSAISNAYPFQNCNSYLDEYTKSVNCIEILKGTYTE